MVYDENKKRVHCQDAYPNAVTLKKGDYMVEAIIRHEKPEFLENLKDMVLVMVKTLEKAVSLPIYPSRHSLLARGEQFSKRRLKSGETVILAMGNPTDKLPKDCLPGK